MAKYYRWLLVIPVLILILGTSMLLSNEAIIKKLYTQENNTVTPTPTATQNIHRPVPKRNASYGDDLKNNRESTYPYFLLGTGLLLFLLVLPKLSELSFSPTGGLTLKVLQEAQTALTEAKTAALAIEAKVKPANRATITAEPLLGTNSPDLKEEIRKLEESTVKLATYTQLLASKARQK